MLDHVTREREFWLLKKEQGFYYKQGVVVHFTLALFETDTLDITEIKYQNAIRACDFTNVTVITGKTYSFFS